MPQIDHARIRQHDELQIRRRLEIVQLVDGGAVGDEVVVRPAQLAHHVPQREDGAEDQLGVVFGAQARSSAGAMDAVAWLVAAFCRWMGGSCSAGERAGGPVFLVDAFRWWGG